MQQQRVGERQRRALEALARRLHGRHGGDHGAAPASYSASPRRRRARRAPSSATSGSLCEGRIRECSASCAEVAMRAAATPPLRHACASPIAKLAPKAHGRKPQTARSRVDALSRRSPRLGGLANQRAHLGKQRAPLLAPLPPTVVAGVVAEAHEDRQRQADQRKKVPALSRANSCRVAKRDKRVTAAANSVIIVEPDRDRPGRSSP